MYVVLAECHHAAFTRNLQCNKYLITINSKSLSSPSGDNGGSRESAAFTVAPIGLPLIPFPIEAQVFDISHRTSACLWWDPSVVLQTVFEG